MARLLKILIISISMLTILTMAIPAFAQVDPEKIRDTFPTVKVFENVKDSLVSVTSVELPYSGYGLYSAYMKIITTSGGTGFMMTSDGYVLTYLGTVQESEVVKVTVGKDEYEADVVATDEFYDTALLKINDPDAEGKTFKPIKWGDSEKMLRGDPVIVIGNPSGGVDKTITYGFVTNFRDLRLQGPHNFDGMLVPRAIEIDAAISSGNMGAPVFNKNGEVISVVNRKGMTIPPGGRLKTEALQDMNYTIPSNIMKNVYDQLYEHGEVFHPWFGVFPYTQLNDRLACYMGIPVKEIDPETGKPYGIVGILINEVASTSPASRAGIRKGDLILKINGNIIRTINQLEKMVLAMDEDQTFDLVLVRNGEIFYKRIRIAEKAKDYANIGYQASI